MLRIAFVVFCLLIGSARVQAATFDYTVWDSLLRAHVRVLDGGRASQVDYAGLLAKRGELQGYLQQLASVSKTDFDSWPVNEQLAFLINAYNGWTVDLILTAYPKLDSIKDLGSIFQSPWKKKFIPLFGATRSLDDIEHGLIRGSGRYSEPRIHFAVNCASIGCPALRPEAYRGDILERQLEEAAALFLGDRSRNRLNGRVLEVSSIFKWYRDDFSSGWRGASSLPDFLVLYKESLGLTADETRALTTGQIEIRFLDYDWRLNGLR